MSYLRAATITAAIATMVLASGAATAGRVKPGKTRCFSDGEASTCAINRDAANLTVYSGGYAGIYLNEKQSAKRNLASVHYSFTANGGVAGGAPRLSIPININGGAGLPDGYAFLDVAGCGGMANTTVTVSTGDANCHVNFLGNDYDNWADLAAAFPAARPSPAALAFVIADQPGTYTIYNVDLR